MHIAVRTESGKTIILDVKSTDTIQTVKWKILAFTKLYICVEELKLIYHNKVLDDYKTLEFYGIRNGYQLLVVARLRGGIKFSIRNSDETLINFDVNSSEAIKDVNVKVNIQKDCKPSDYKISVSEKNSTLNLSVQPMNVMEIYVEMGNSIITLNVVRTSTIMSVKKKIQDLNGHHINHQRLLFDGIQLSDNRTLADYKIKDKDLLRLCLRPFSGGPINMSNNIRIIINKVNSTIPLDVKLTDSVDSVKLKLYKLGCHPPSRQVLIHGLRKLQEEKTLFENGIKDKSHIILAYYVEDGPEDANSDESDETNTLQIFVKCIGGKTIRLFVNPSDITENIKARIEDLLGFPRGKQKLAFDGRSLQNGLTLSDQNISQDSTIRCSIKFTNDGCAQCRLNKKRLTYYGFD